MKKYMSQYGKFVLSVLVIIIIISWLKPLGAQIFDLVLNTPVAEPKFGIFAESEKTTTLKTGKVVNAALKKLVNSTTTYYKTEDLTITSISFDKNYIKPESGYTEIQETGVPVYAWKDRTTIKITSDADIVYANADSSYLFYNFENLSSINFDIDTSKVTNMSYMFGNAGYDSDVNFFNLDLSNWNVSNVTDMSYMFNGAGYSATTWSIGGLSNWNTSNVTNMFAMFYDAGHKATTFNLDLSNWDVSNVTNMMSMFFYAAADANTFKLNISNWNASKVTTMEAMFGHTADYATNWEVIIPKKTGTITNTATKFYGKNPSVYTPPAFEKSFSFLN